MTSKTGNEQWSDVRNTVRLIPMCLCARCKVVEIVFAQPPRIAACRQTSVGSGLSLFGKLQRDPSRRAFARSGKRARRCQLYEVAMFAGAFLARKTLGQTSGFEMPSPVLVEKDEISRCRDWPCMQMEGEPTRRTFNPVVLVLAWLAEASLIVRR